MLDLNERYVTDKQGRIVAVQVDFETFQRVENILEDLVLARLLSEVAEEDKMSLQEAKAFYSKINAGNAR